LKAKKTKGQTSMKSTFQTKTRFSTQTAKKMKKESETAKKTGTTRIAQTHMTKPLPLATRSNAK
jgi:hypothetical protein